MIRLTPRSVVFTFIWPTSLLFFAAAFILNSYWKTAIVVARDNAKIMKEDVQTSYRIFDYHHDATHGPLLGGYKDRIFSSPWPSSSIAFYRDIIEYVFPKATISYLVSLTSNVDFDVQFVPIGSNTAWYRNVEKIKSGGGRPPYECRTLAFGVVPQPGEPCADIKPYSELKFQVADDPGLVGAALKFRVTYENTETPVTLRVSDPADFAANVVKMEQAIKARELEISQRPKTIERMQLYCLWVGVLCFLSPFFYGAFLSLKEKFG